MLELGHPRDLVMIGAIFGVAGFVWAGWAQAGPPAHWWWRLLLGLLGLTGLALVAVSIPLAISHWNTPTALRGGTAALFVYIIVFWVEMILAGVLVFFALRNGRTDLIAPLVLAVVGVHFLALAPVFGQPVLYLAAVLLTTIAVLAALVPGTVADRSFWCGVLGAPVFLAIGAWATVAATTVFRHI